MSNTDVETTSIEPAPIPSGPSPSELRDEAPPDGIDPNLYSRLLDMDGVALLAHKDSILKTKDGAPRNYSELTDSELIELSAALRILRRRAIVPKDKIRRTTSVKATIDEIANL